MKFVLRHKHNQTPCDENYTAEIHMDGSFSVNWNGIVDGKNRLWSEESDDFELILARSGEKNILISTTPAPEDPDLDLEKLKEMLHAIQTLGLDPLIDYMKREGFDPEKGGIMIWPMGKVAFWPAGMQPYYIQVSNLVDDIQLIHREWYGEKCQAGIIKNETSIG